MITPIKLNEIRILIRPFNMIYIKMYASLFCNLFNFV